MHIHFRSSTAVLRLSHPPQRVFYMAKREKLQAAVMAQAVLELVQLKPTVIRGNASEIMAVAGAAGVTTKGVDSTAEPEEALELGKRLAAEAGCVVAISGATDLASRSSPALVLWYRAPLQMEWVGDGGALASTGSWCG